MKCPNCGAEMVQTKRDRIDLELCPSCAGMWLTNEELIELEDQVFDFGDDEKGSLMLGSDPSPRKCPQCGKAMRSFQYRLYDVQLDCCGDGHGFWLSADEDKRILDIMKKEEKDLGRKVLAEDRWAAHLNYLRSGSVGDRIRDLVRKAIDPRPRT